VRQPARTAPVSRRGSIGMIHAMTVGGARGARRVATALLRVLLAAACTPAGELAAGRPRRHDPLRPRRPLRVLGPRRRPEQAGGVLPRRRLLRGALLRGREHLVRRLGHRRRRPGPRRRDARHDRPAQPFRDWSWVFIPSCSGDIHLGDRRVRYGPVTVQQRGWHNAHAAMDWAFAHVPNPAAVLVAGCSAGSVGSAFHVPAILDHWPGPAWPRSVTRWRSCSTAG
jgi:Pectinacetylesterase